MAITEQTTRRGPAVEPPSPARPSGGKAAISGVLAAALALGITELVAGAFEFAPSLVEAIGGFIIDTVPPAIESFAIALFATYDKIALVVGIVLVAFAFGAVLGTAAARSMLAGIAGLVFFGLLGVLAVAADGGRLPGAVFAAAAGIVAGAAALRWLLARALRPAPDAPVPGDSRRGFVTSSLVVAGLAALSAAGGRWLFRREQLAQRPQQLVLPPVASPLPPPPPEADLHGQLPLGDGTARSDDYDISELAPLFTPNEDFYRIDTALTIPVIDETSWSLQVSGMVDRPFGLSYQQLLDMPQVERDITLACVSNEVGGHLIGNARWVGVPLEDILEQAGVQPQATQVVGRAVDGFTVGFPTSAVFDGRESLVAVGMNGEPLPSVHGFPARLVVAGLYGYVSATKWLSEIELTTFDGFDAYWVPRGWSKEGPIKTQSRIDVPRDRAVVPAGPQAIAGVAWAGIRGIRTVEIRIDDGPWQTAGLGAELDNDTWRQWFHSWDAQPGVHTIEVRATDQEGQTQTRLRTPVRPGGATGHHTIQVTVEER